MPTKLQFSPEISLFASENNFICGSGHTYCACLRPFIAGRAARESIITIYPHFAGFRDAAGLSMDRRFAPIQWPGQRLIVRAAVLALLGASAADAQADIFQWEWVDPNNPG